MADSLQNDEPGFFAYLSQEELTNVREMQIRTHLSSADRRPESGPELVAKCVELLGETRVLAAIKSQLPAPRYSWTAHTVIVSARQVARWGHSSTLYLDHLYLYGGRGADQYCRSSFYYVDVGSMRAFYIKTSRFPKAREGHTCVRHKDCLYLYGGCEGGGDKPVVYFSDLNAFDIFNKKWRNVWSSGDVPMGRDSHSCGVLEDRMLVYGGNTANGLSDEVFTFNFSRASWTKHRTVGWNPGKRESSGSCVLRNKMYLFGGNVNEDCSSTDICTNDLFSFSLAHGEVHCEAIRSLGATPPPRASHSLTAVDDHCFVLIGGESHDGLLSDVWVYLVDYCCWVQAQSQVPISCKMAHTAVADKGKVLVFGGMDKDSNPRSELLVISFQNLPFAAAQSPAPVSSTNIRCVECGHNSSFCSEREGSKYPVLSYFSRIAVSADSVKEAADHYTDPYLPLLAVARLVGGSLVKVELLAGEMQTTAQSQCESSDSSTSADTPGTKVLQLQANTSLEPESVLRVASGRLLGSIAAIGHLAVVVSRCKDFLTVLALRILEETVESHLLVYDKEGNCIYPESRVYLKTLEIVVRLSGIQLAKLTTYAQGTTIYFHTRLYSKRMSSVYSPSHHSSFSLSDFLQYANHHSPASQQFTVVTTLVVPRFSPECGDLVWDRTPRYASCRFSAPGPSSIRVYYSNSLVYLWVEELVAQKRPRSDHCDHLIVELLCDKYLFPDGVSATQTLNVQLAWELLSLGNSY